MLRQGEQCSQWPQPQPNGATIRVNVYNVSEYVHCVYIVGGHNTNCKRTIQVLITLITQLEQLTLDSFDCSQTVVNSS